MGSKRSVFNYLLFNSVFMLTFCSIVNGQATFDRYQSFVLGVDSSVNISNYDKTYIVHFNFCTAPKYCGQNLIKLIERNKGKQILILCDDTKNKYLQKLKNNSYRLVQVDFLQMDRHGLFSVYNIEITKKRKVKKLI